MALPTSPATAKQCSCAFRTPRARVTAPSFTRTSSWVVNTDGSGGKKILDAYNANWQPKTLLRLPDSGFWFQWRVPDQPVATGQSTRPYLWGPTAIYSGTEPFAASPNGQQQVIYFDKGRMDLPNPNPPQPTRFLVVPGTLARELVTGQIAIGVTQTQSLAPSEVPVAGDIRRRHRPHLRHLQ